MQGEELRKQIGAAAYIECSSKTQQVDRYISWTWDLKDFIASLLFPFLIREAKKSSPHA